MIISEVLRTVWQKVDPISISSPAAIPNFRSSTVRQATHRSAVTRATPAKRIRVASITVSRIVPTSSFSARRWMSDWKSCCPA